MELSIETIKSISTIIGVLGGILGIINQLSNMRKTQDEMIRQQALRDQEMDDRLKSIENKVESHNRYAEKFASLTEAIVEMKTDIKWIKEQK